MIGNVEGLEIEVGILKVYEGDPFEGGLVVNDVLQEEIVVTEDNWGIQI
jgi:hypothetical protein